MGKHQATEDTGDEKCLLRVYLAYEPDIRIVLGAPIGTASIGCINRLADGSFELTFSVDRGSITFRKRQRHVVKVDPFLRHGNMWPIVPPVSMSIQAVTRKCPACSIRHGTEEFAKLVRIDDEVVKAFEFTVDREGLACVKVTQMGNVPIVMDSIRVGPFCVCSGPTLSFKFQCTPVGTKVIVYCKVLKEP